MTDPSENRAAKQVRLVTARDVEEGRRGFGELLANLEFRLIWASQIASQLADKFLVYSLLTVTYQRSRANTQEAVVLLAYTFPSVILSPIAAASADPFAKPPSILSPTL